MNAIRAVWAARLTRLITDSATDPIQQGSGGDIAAFHTVELATGFLHRALRAVPQ